MRYRYSVSAAEYQPAAQPYGVRVRSVTRSLYRQKMKEVLGAGAEPSTQTGGSGRACWIENAARYCRCAAARRAAP